MKVLLTGATGFLGRTVARRLAARGHALRVLARPTSRIGGLPAGIEVATGDVTDVRSRRGRRRLRRHRAHGRAREDLGPGPGALRGGERGRAAERARRGPRRPARLVYTSSFIALGPSGDGALDASRPHPGPYRNAYERTKAEADALAREAAADGQDVVILYPGVVYGPGDMTEGNIVARMIADHLNGRLPALVGPGDRRWSYAFVEDVAEGHALALEKGKPGDRFVLGGENATLAQLFALVQEIAGAAPPRLHLPYAVASALGRAQWLWAELTGHAPQLTHGEVGVFREHWACDSAQGGARARLRAAPARRGPPRDGALAARRGPRPAVRERVVSLGRGERGPPRRPRRLRRLRAPPALAHVAAGRALRARGLRLQLAGPAAGRRPGDVARGRRRARLPGRHPRLPARRARLVLVFRDRLWMAAAGWGILAVGDGMASLVGQAMGGPRLPWNARKGWVGFASFVVFGTAAAALLSAWTARLRSTPTPPTGRAPPASPSPSPSRAPSSSRSPRRSTTT